MWNLYHVFKLFSSWKKTDFAFTYLFFGQVLSSCGKPIVELIIPSGTTQEGNKQEKQIDGVIWDLKNAKIILWKF